MVTKILRNFRLPGSGAASGVLDMTENILRLVIGENPPPRLDKALAEVMPEGSAISRSRIGKLIVGGAVMREGAAIVRILKTRTQPGDVWLVHVPEAGDIVAQPEDIALEIVYEDSDLIVVNKPAGMVVHPAPGSETGTLVNALLFHCADSLSGIGGAKRPGIVHRIDKDTSGLLVVAKNDAAHQGLATQFADHSISRHYRAVVYGVPSRGDPRLAGIRGIAFEEGNIIRISGNIARHKTDRKRMAVTIDAGRHAITRLRVVEGFSEAAALVDCWLETGRTHQIRVHLTHAGHALIGDMTYGGRRAIGAKSLMPEAIAAVQTFPRQALHAATLGFVHPVSGGFLEFEAPLPTDMATLLKTLREGANGATKS